MDVPTANDLHEARRPLASLLHKSEKAQQKLSPGTWQHTMLGGNVKALRVALFLMGIDPPGKSCFRRSDLQETLRALTSVVARTGKAQEMFSAGTSHHTLQRNRLRALQVAVAVVGAELRNRDFDSGTAPDSSRMSDFRGV